MQIDDAIVAIGIHHLQRLIIKRALLLSQILHRSHFLDLSLVLQEKLLELLFRFILLDILINWRLLAVHISLKRQRWLRNSLVGIIYNDDAGFPNQLQGHLGALFGLEIVVGNSRLHVGR